MVPTNDAVVAEAKREMWHRCDLSYLLRPEQLRLKQLLADTASGIAVVNFSRRTGKSTTCSAFCIEQALQKKQLLLYATAFLTDLEAFIIPIFEWCMRDCPDELRPVWQASKKQFKFQNGSVIKLIGIDKNPNGLRGNAIDILIIDEAAFINNLDYLYRSVIVPATANREFRLIFPSTPPESPEHFWSKELIPKAKAVNAYLEMTLDQSTLYSDEEKERLINEVGGRQSPTAQREFFCKILVDATRSIAPSFNPKLHVQSVEPDCVHWMIFGDSGGVRDKTVFLQVGWSHELQKIIFRDELVYEPKTASSTIIDGYKQKWPKILALVLDAPTQLLIDYSSLGLAASFPMKDEFSAGLALLNNVFHNNQVIVHPDCKLLARTLEGGLLNKARIDYERSTALGHCDAVASAIYALRGVDRLTDLRPKPSRMNIFTPPHLQNPHLTNLRKLGHS